VTRGCDCAGATTRYVERPNGFYVYTKNRDPARLAFCSRYNSLDRAESRATSARVVRALHLRLHPPRVVIHSVHRDTAASRRGRKYRTNDVINLFPVVEMHLASHERVVSRLQEPPAISLRASARFLRPRDFYPRATTFCPHVPPLSGATSQERERERERERENSREIYLSLSFDNVGQPRALSTLANFFLPPPALSEQSSPQFRKKSLLLISRVFFLIAERLIEERALHLEKHLDVRSADKHAETRKAKPDPPIASKIPILELV